MRKIAFLPLFALGLLQAQSINIGNFYYRDYLDFGQNKGSFGSGNGTLTGKDGTSLSVPSVPNFAASSNNGNLTAIGRGFVVTANHVTSPENPTSNANLRKWGLTEYTISGESYTSQGYGRDEKFFRFDKYIVEGQADMLNVENSLIKADATKESQNINTLKDELKNFADSEGNIYLYQAGSGVITLRGGTNTELNRMENGETRGGGFGTLGKDSIVYDCLVQSQNCDTRGIRFNYNPNLDFNNRITSGDSGSGIYAYDKKNNKWVLLGVTSQEWGGQNRAFVSFVSNKDFEDYQKNFEQKIDLSTSAKWTMNNQNLSSTTLLGNKDIIFSGGGNIKVTGNIYRNISGQAGGFVFTATNSATKDNPTKYSFTNNGNFFFKGSGLDIGENVVVEWGLRNQSGDSLHKIGKGELIVKTDYAPNSNENLGTLKLGEGKVTLDTATKAFEGIYITSGRGELALKTGKAEALGAVKDSGRDDISTLANSYTLTQDSTSQMGFYFGTGGGKLDLAGNSLHLNTIAANDSKAIITNSSTSLVDLEIQGFGYDNNGAKTSQKANTIIHASFGESANSGNANGTPANLNLIYKDSKAHNASLIFDGHINIKGALNATNSNIVLQGHPTTHATISDAAIRDKITSAENGTSQKMPDYMDLSKPSNLKQPDWDSRNFSIAGGITLTNATLMVGKGAKVSANINADSSSQISFGGTHFIDESDTKNVRGSGFDYYQRVISGALNDYELYKDSSYSGTINANGASITSQFVDFAPNLELSNGANLSAKYLTLNTNSNFNLSTNSSAQVENLIFKDFANNDFSSKFKLDNTSTFSITQALSFDNSTFDLSKLANANLNLTLPAEYNLYALNGSKITATNFTNSKENAEFWLDNSTFTATSVSFQSAELTLQNGANFKANSLNFSEQSALILNDKAALTLANGLQAQNLNLNLSNSSTLNAKTLTSNGASTINLNDKATLTLTDTFTSENLRLTLANASTFTAQTLNASGVFDLLGDENSSATLNTLTLNGEKATLNAKANITNLNLNNLKETTIGENVAISTLNLSQSNANLQDLSANLPQNITLNSNSNLFFNELNLNTSTLNLTSDEHSKAHIKRLIYDAQNGANKTPPQSNFVVSEKFELKNVGANLGTTQGADDEKLQKDLFTLKFDKNLELGKGASLDINFADKVTKDNANLLFDKDYTIFTAQNLLYSSDFSNISFNLNGSDFFAKGKFDKDTNAFLVQFVRENPRNFDELNPHINPAYSPLLDILLQHNQNDESIEKAINLGDYSALNTRLARLDTSFTNLANADKRAFKTLPRLQKQEINARIQQNRFTNAKFALARAKNLMQKSDVAPTLSYLIENERKNRAWSSAGVSFFSNKGDTFNLQSISLGYDRRFFGDEFLLGVMASLTNAQLSANDISFNPKIYTLAFYSDALFARGELQNQLSLSHLNGDKSFESENSSYKSLNSFFESIYKAEISFLPQNLKPIVLGRVNLSRFDDFNTPTYKQKADNDISVDFGIGVEWLWQKEMGFYTATFTAERDIFHTQKQAKLSLSGAQKFVEYEINDPSFTYQLYLSGSESFKNGIYLRYGLSAFVDSKAYKGVKADVQVGYKF